jgi:predicted transcriptional regulator
MNPKLIAYEFILQDLPNRQRQVLTCILLKPNITIQEIGQMLRLPINSISGRLYELETKKEIKGNGNKYYTGQKQPQTKWLVS